MGDFAAALRRNAEDGGRELPGALARKTEERPAWTRREAAPEPEVDFEAFVKPVVPVPAAVVEPPAPVPTEVVQPPVPAAVEQPTVPAPVPAAVVQPPAPAPTPDAEQLLRDVLGENAPPRPADLGVQQPRPARRAATPPGGRRPPGTFFKLVRATGVAAAVAVSVFAGFLSANRAVQEKIASNNASATAVEESALLVSSETVAPSEAAAEEANQHLEQVTTAETPDERVAAISEMALGGPQNVKGALRNLLHDENDAEVRAELYSALAFDAGETFANARPQELAEMSLVEEEPAARLQGFRLVASMLRFDSNGELAQTFDASMVPWLKDEALSEGTHYSRLVAVDALKLANTWAATEALHDISRSPVTQVAQAADRAIYAQNRLR
jgi:hypothetical protein